MGFGEPWRELGRMGFGEPLVMVGRMGLGGGLGGGLEALGVSCGLGRALMFGQGLGLSVWANHAWSKKASWLARSLGEGCSWFARVGARVLMGRPANP